jgi:ABC-type transport system involved in multi-copper enzyme maturation permease subunit
MSLQTGVETPSGPASRRVGDRMRYRIRLWQTEPNPLWMREMRQSARLMRTPVIMMTLAVLMTLLMTSLGSGMSGSLSPAKAGSALFQTYFSLAYFVVALIGPALAANSIASEREGKTWEAVLLTGMRPQEIARGKFMAAYTSIAMYIVMLAPVGAMPFLFGGVTPLEVLVAFIFLFLVALLSVAFGLAISSKMQSLRGALLITLLLAIPIALFLFLTFGVGLSYAAHDLWPTVEDGLPVWLPSAYGRASFGLEYLVYLVALPTAAITIPAWFLYEVTTANLTSVTDDRGRGLKRWYLVTTLLLTVVATVPMFAVSGRERAAALMFGLAGLLSYVIFCAFLFAGEPIGPSRRVRAMLSSAGKLRRFLGPGVIPAGRMQLLFTILSLAALLALGLSYINVAGSPRATRQTEQLVLFGSYTMGFAVFCVGLAGYLRARANNTALPRVLLVVILFAIAALPWFIALVTGAVVKSSSPTSASMAVASPSPFYVFIAIDAVKRSDPGVAILASMVCSIGYGLLGIILFGAAARRCKKIIVEHERVLAEADRRLAEEDAQQHALATEVEQAQEPTIEDLERPARTTDPSPADVAPEDATAEAAPSEDATAQASTSDDPLAPADPPAVADGSDDEPS